jgi:hypothetical protein
VAQRVIIEFTDTFRQTYRELPEAIQQKVQKQLRFLFHDPSHHSEFSKHPRRSDTTWRRVNDGTKSVGHSTSGSCTDRMDDALHVTETLIE